MRFHGRNSCNLLTVDSSLLGLLNINILSVKDLYINKEQHEKTKLIKVHSEEGF